MLVPDKLLLLSDFTIRVLLPLRLLLLLKLLVNAAFTSCDELRNPTAPSALPQMSVPLLLLLAMMTFCEPSVTPSGTRGAAAAGVPFKLKLCNEDDLLQLFALALAVDDGTFSCCMSKEAVSAAVAVKAASSVLVCTVSATGASVVGLFVFAFFADGFFFTSKSFSESETESTNAPFITFRAAAAPAAARACAALLTLPG